MSTESHTIMDGKVHIYRRENSSLWQCSLYLSSRNHRASTGQKVFARAIEIAREWAMDRLAEDRLRRRSLPASSEQPSDAQQERARKAKAKGPTFSEAAAAFVAEYEVITNGERNAQYVAQKSRQLDLHLLPFFGDKPVGEVTAGLIQEYRVHRMTEHNDEVAGTKADPEYWSRPKNWRNRKKGRPARATMHSEMVTLRQVLKTANRKGWITGLPDMSTPYKSSGKISRRAWFSPEEYKRLYEATRERARNPKNERWRAECEQLHDYVLFMVNTGLRPDECSRLEYRDVNVVVDDDTDQCILEIEVRGKRGVGYCKSMPGAVQPFTRLRKRNDPKANDKIFGPVQRELLNAVLTELDLKKDRDGQARTAYSLRHTYICLRLMEGADIYQLAKNCRTSVEMIETYYASHIKNMLDASAINVRKKPKSRKAPSATEALANA
jgi:integrase